jgi:hypothetical protein
MVIGGASRVGLPESSDQIAGLGSLPNDLTRLLYLSSLRDCNSGCYLHPQLSPKMGTAEAHRVLYTYHDVIFRRLLAAPISEYVFQLEEYIRYARTERETVFRTWQSLEAYRATVPVSALKVYRHLFCLNVEIALAILVRKESRQRPAHQAVDGS